MCLLLSKRRIKEGEWIRRTKKRTLYIQFYKVPTCAQTERNCATGGNITRSSSNPHCDYSTRPLKWNQEDGYHRIQFQAKSRMLLVSQGDKKRLAYTVHKNFPIKSYFIVCGNKMPTRCNRGCYCRSYCLLNMFRASLCPSSGAQEYYTVVAACSILCCGFFK